MNSLKLRRVLTIIFIVSFCLSGVAAAAIAISCVKNYFHPWLFGCLTAMFGILVGCLVALICKPAFAFNIRWRNHYHRIIFIFCIGFIGYAMLIGHYLNQTFSSRETCGDYLILHKLYNKGSRERVNEILLIVDIKGKPERLYCSLSFYEYVKIGDELIVCRYSSPFGFSYYQLPGDKPSFSFN
jgi:glucan phosphoethanolaminetransferase (alkaline phosphatase superfamily)